MCIAWAHLEEGCYTILLYTLHDIEYTAYELIRNELDLRRALQVCKAHAVANNWAEHSNHIPALVDLIDNEVRNARNRYVHDPITAGVKSYSRQTYATRFRKTPHRLDVEMYSFADISSDEIYALTRAIRALESYSGSIIQYLDWLDGEDPRDWPYPTMESAQLSAYFAIKEYTHLTTSR